MQFCFNNHQNNCSWYNYLIPKMFPLPPPILEPSRQLYLPPFLNENFNDPNLSLFEKSPSPAPQQLKESLKTILGNVFFFNSSSLLLLQLVLLGLLASYYEQKQRNRQSISKTLIDELRDYQSCCQPCSKISLTLKFLL